MQAPEPHYRQLLLDLLTPGLRRHSISPDDVEDDLNVVDRGIVDSVEFLNLVARLEQHTGVELPLYDVDPRALTTVGGLIDLLCEAEDSRTSSRSVTHE